MNEPNQKPHQYLKEDLLEKLAESDECENSQASASGESMISTVKDLKQELDLLASKLREPLPHVPYEDESDCQHAVELIEAYGIDPSTLDVSIAVSPASQTKPRGDIGQYQLEAQVGQGGMGTVYRAFHKSLKRYVALKILPERLMRSPDAVARFEREMEAVGKLEHPNIVRAMDAGVADGTHYLVMEYIQGIDLSKLAHRLGQLPYPDACELIRQAAIGLQHAHEHDLVHRDVKPGNLMLSVRDKHSKTIESRSPGGPKHHEPIVKILDLGLARLGDSDANSASELTSAGQVMGTLDYMAPEQRMDSHVVDIRADIYSLGATLFKLLTGTTPLKMILTLGTETAPSIGEQRNDLPAELVRVLDRMLSWDLHNRYAAPHEVAAALQPFCGGSDLYSLLNRAMLTEDGNSFAEPSVTSTRGLVSSASVDTTEVHGNKIPRDFAQDRAAGSGATPVSHAAKSDPKSVRKNSREMIPPAMRIATLVGLAGILLLGVMLFIQFKDGTVVVEIDDPEGLIQVSVVGEDILITDKQKNGESIELSPGDHQLHVTRGDLAFNTDNFTLKRGGKVVLSVKLVGGDVRVVRTGAVETVIGRQTLEAENERDSSTIHCVGTSRLDRKRKSLLNRLRSSMEIHFPCRRWSHNPLQSTDC